MVRKFLWTNINEYMKLKLNKYFHMLHEAKNSHQKMQKPFETYSKEVKKMCIFTHHTFLERCI